MVLLSASTSTMANWAQCPKWAVSLPSARGTAIFITSDSFGFFCGLLSAPSSSPASTWPERVGKRLRRRAVGIEIDVRLARIARPRHRRIHGNAARKGTLKSSAICSPPKPGKISVRFWQCGQMKPLMFSTIPVTGRLNCLQKVTHLRTSSTAKSCGVVTITTPSMEPEHLCRRQGLRPPSRAGSRR